MVVLWTWRTSRPYPVGVSFHPPLVQPWLPVVTILAVSTAVGAGCGVVLWLAGWPQVRGEASEDERRRRRGFLLGRTVAAALGGITVGMAPLLVLLYLAFTSTVADSHHRAHKCRCRVLFVADARPSDAIRCRHVRGRVGPPGM